MSAMLLAIGALATPVQINSAAEGVLAARQLGSLGSLTGILKGIMDQNTGSQAAPAPATPSQPSVSQYEDCSEAIQKIDDALNTSERFMKASGGEPTIKDVQAVLAVLSDSLARDCDDGDMTARDVSVMAEFSALEGRDMQKCSDCERQLYNIIRGLQAILAMTEEGKGGVASTVGGVMSTIMLPTFMSTTMMVTMTTTVVEFPTIMSMA